jgi:hypothetical protein
MTLTVNERKITTSASLISILLDRGLQIFEIFQQVVQANRDRLGYHYR